MEKYRNLIAKAQEPLTDKEYLAQYIADMHLFNSHKIFAVRDLNSIYLDATLACADKYMFGCDILKTIGRTYSDVPESTEHADMFYAQDRQIEQTRSSIRLLHVYNGMPPIDCRRAVIINPATNNVVGTYVNRIKLEMGFGLKTILDIHGVRFGKHKCMNVSDNPGTLGLTAIELDVLFCICLGINQRKDVANFLSVLYKRTINADTTVHDAFRRLYRKFDCNTPMQLLEYAVCGDLHLQIPPAFMPTGVFKLNNHINY